MLYPHPITNLSTHFLDLGHIVMNNHVIHDSCDDVHEHESITSISVLDCYNFIVAFVDDSLDNNVYVNNVLIFVGL